MARSKKNKSRDKKNSPNSTETENSVSLKKSYSCAFTFLVAGVLLRCVPNFSDTAWFCYVAWLCFYSASLIFAFKSKELGKKCGASQLVLGVAGVSLAVLLCKVEAKELCQMFDYLALDQAKKVTFFLDLFALLLIWFGSFGLVLGAWYFLQDFIPRMKQRIQRSQARKSQHDNADDKKNIEVSDINDYLGLLFVILQIVYFFIEKYA